MRARPKMWSSMAWRARTSSGLCECRAHVSSLGPFVPGQVRHPVWVVLLPQGPRKVRCGAHAATWRNTALHQKDSDKSGLLSNMPSNTTSRPLATHFHAFSTRIWKRLPSDFTPSTGPGVSTPGSNAPPQQFQQTIRKPQPRLRTHLPLLRSQIPGQNNLQNSSKLNKRSAF